MKFLISSIAALLFTAASAFAANPPWTADWEAAKAKSKAENKPILIYMTGSDWCGWCKKLEKEVISKKEFTDFASQHFILMEADFPKTKDQPAPLKKQNAELRKTYLNGGYPTMYVLDAEGKKLSKDLGELEGGLNGYIAKLKELLPKNGAPK
ncbi:MAG: thioredoxin family protein [Akkermansiaceae bacterium]|nr:thioredoxin family protein [Akkermansiaceae bacterium]